MQTLTDGERILTRILTLTESILANYLEDERQAVALAPHVKLPDTPTGDQIDAAIAEVLVNALTAAGENTTVLIEYLGGERRDTVRNPALREAVSQRGLRGAGSTATDRQ
jgi:hypothetical protein